MHARTKYIVTDVKKGIHGNLIENKVLKIKYIKSSIVFQMSI